MVRWPVPVADACQAFHEGADEARHAALEALDRGGDHRPGLRCALVLEMRCINVEEHAELSEFAIDLDELGDVHGGYPRVLAVAPLECVIECKAFFQSRGVRFDPVAKV